MELDASCSPQSGRCPGMVEASVSVQAICDGDVLQIGLISHDMDQVRRDFSRKSGYYYPPMVSGIRAPDTCCMREIYKGTKSLRLKSAIKKLDEQGRSIYATIKVQVN